MTTLSISSPKPQGFYSQSLQDKLYPFLSNGENLTLSDAIDLSQIAVEGAWWANQTRLTQTLGQIMAQIEANCADYEFDGFDGYADEFRAVELQLVEWLALARWASELAECRLRDYSNAQVREMAAQSPPIWEVL